MKPSAETSNNFLLFFFHLPLCPGFIGDVGLTGVESIIMVPFLNKDAMFALLQCSLIF